VKYFRNQYETSQEKPGGGKKKAASITHILEGLGSNLGGSKWGDRGIGAYASS
jgi:hypothetical protein